MHWGLVWNGISPKKSENVSVSLSETKQNSLAWSELKDKSCFVGLAKISY